MAATEAKSDKCPCCSSMHKIYTCKRFKELSQSECFNIVRDARLCFNCLSPYHGAPACQSTLACLRCKRRHNTLLHFEKTNQVESNGRINFESSVEEQPTTSYNSDNQQTQFQACIATRSINSHAFLATAIVLVQDCYDTYRECRVILDSGSQLNFISKRLENMLQLPSKRTLLPISGIGANIIQSSSSVELQVRSRIKSFKVNMPCQILPVIINELPSVEAPISGWTIPDHLSCDLADPTFSKSSSIDLLIGCSIFFDLIEPERIPLDIDNVVLQNTKFGWVVTGEVCNICLLSIGQAIEDWQIIKIRKDQMLVGHPR